MEEGSEHFVVENFFLQSFDRSIFIRYFGRNDSVWIPRTVEILGSFCFSDCRSLSSISIESDSLLRRIESDAFSSSSLTFIVIPRTVEILDGSVFSGCERISISIEEGSEHFVVENFFFQSFDRSIFIRYFGRDDSVWIPRTVEILGSFCFHCCGSLSSISIESDSLFRRIESSAFCGSSLPSIVIPRKVEVLGSSCFSDCKSLSSFLIESDLLVRRIESEAFSSTNLMSVRLPVDVEFISVNAFPDYCQVLRK
jgi:hypothetical protein